MKSVLIVEEHIAKSGRDCQEIVVCHGEFVKMSYQVIGSEMGSFRWLRSVIIHLK
jgi:hypothetical protein